MEKYMNYKFNKAMKDARKRRQNRFWISILQMLIFLTAVSLIFTFFINIVWANPVEEESDNGFIQESATERKVFLVEKEMPEIKRVEKVEEQLKSVATVEEKEDFPYKEHLNLPKEHQKYLYEKCMALGIDFEKALAVMEHESKFDVNAIGETKDYGYFQINLSNHDWLSEVTDTKKKPLDPYINIDWGTYLLNDLNEYWAEKGLTGQALDEAVWSSYNKGIKGFKKTGKATEYVGKVYESLNLVKQ